MCLNTDICSYLKGFLKLLRNLKLRNAGAQRGKPREEALLGVNRWESCNYSSWVLFVCLFVYQASFAIQLIKQNMVLRLCNNSQSCFYDESGNFTLWLTSVHCSSADFSHCPRPKHSSSSASVPVRIPEGARDLPVHGLPEAQREVHSVLGRAW